jgi:hypothetical protein
MRPDEQALTKAKQAFWAPSQLWLEEKIERGVEAAIRAYGDEMERI